MVHNGPSSWRMDSVYDITQAYKDFRDKVITSTSLKGTGEFTVVNECFKTAQKDANKAWKDIMEVIGKALEGKTTSCFASLHRAWDYGIPLFRSHSSCMGLRSSEIHGGASAWKDAYEEKKGEKTELKIHGGASAWKEGYEERDGRRVEIKIQAAAWKEGYEESKGEMVEIKILGGASAWKEWYEEREGEREEEKVPWYQGTKSGWGGVYLLNGDPR
ncbi:hypothetical protein PRIPAC_96189 [Pristionchus pacificus]|uniref:Uncharacterized protein n=1 Tax=Pristionchus pacificus TaxID=54126 RepID=A0A2A6D239_PRIPA|nr:hypothetical protein PRIPAC_96189 [Pristionchus pacificus]|eukprot:PDM84468.1 hypothetical protein PRIPAC_33491 [Pristionchus pacificus]